MKTALLLITIIWALGLDRSHAQGDLASENTKLREALRNTTLQLRSAQEDAAIATAALEQRDAENVRLNERLEEIMAARIREQDDTSARIKDLENQLATASKNLQALSQNLLKWQNAYEEAAKVAREKEGARIQAEIKAAALEVTVSNLQRSNNELYQTGKEILDRYEKFGLGTALTAREPFVGTTRVRLQTLVQDFGDKLDDQRAQP
ncbi:MAG: phage major capsid protein [Verrucomicrobiales bacterium]